MTRLSKEEIRKKWAEVVAKAWMDEKFKARLLQNPRQVLKEYGIEEMAHLDLKVVEDTSKIHYLILPEKPAGKLSEAELRSIAAAGPPMMPILPPNT